MFGKMQGEKKINFEVKKAENEILKIIRFADSDSEFLGKILIEENTFNDKEKLFTNMEKLVAQQESERHTLETRISSLDKENQEFEIRLEEEIASRNSAEKKLAHLSKAVADDGKVSGVSMDGLELASRSASKVAAARLLCSVLDRQAKSETAAAFRKWSCNASALAAVSTQKDTAIALSQQLQITREKLHTLKSHLKHSRKGHTDKKQKPRLRRLLDRLDKREKGEPEIVRHAEI